MKTSAWVYNCNHKDGKCTFYHNEVHCVWANPQPPPTEEELDTLHNQHVAEWDQMIREREEGALTENSTQVDPEEQEDGMNNMPSPYHTHSRFWNPEYEARRQARKRLWSPPLTPESGGLPYHSLQPSQRPPSPQRRRPRSPSSKPQVEGADVSGPIKPRSAQYKVAKARPPPTHSRPATRSTKPPKLASLHHRKGYVVVRSAKNSSRIVLNEMYLEALLKRSVSGLSPLLQSALLTITQVMPRRKSHPSSAQAKQMITIPAV
ncbi:MAG: hypothetical protein Q9172_004043 [Xanthocarpia lactea]